MYLLFPVQLIAFFTLLLSNPGSICIFSKSLFAPIHRLEIAQPVDSPINNQNASSKVVPLSVVII
jgi:hypothetical protein